MSNQIKFPFQYRTAIFIDAGYLDKVLKNEFNEARIDYSKLIEEIKGNTELLRTYYYHCMPFKDTPPTEEQKTRFAQHQKFIYYLKQVSRLELRQGKLVKRGEEYEQKLVDILLSVDLTRLSWTKQINMASLITGDRDYVPAVKNSKHSGVIVRLYYSRSAISGELLEACDERYEITQDMIDKVLRDSPAT